jgi:prepilin-type N-terminal cleavage/methylation domain-containing protein/prepilin-type processing-associated H-X9-DG protein
MEKYMRSNKAFTLIELLVVIAIIAILAAILFPVFAQAKLAAKAVSDLSNIKQIDTAMIMYTNDYDDMYTYATPESWSGAPAWGSTTMGWTYNLQPYSKSINLFRSPLDSGFVPKYTWEGPGVSYGLNSFTAPNTAAEANFINVGGTDAWGGRCFKATRTYVQDCTLRGISSPFSQVFGQGSTCTTPGAACGGELNVSALTTTQVTHPGESIAIATRFFTDSVKWGGDGIDLNFECSGYFEGVPTTNGSNSNVDDCGPTELPNGDIPASVLPPEGQTGAVGQVKTGGSNFAYVDGHAKYSNIAATNPDPDNTPSKNLWDALRP